MSQMFKTSVLIDLSKLEHDIIIELNGFRKKGRERGHCNVLMRRKAEFTRRFVAVKLLQEKGILVIGKRRMNMVSYCYTSEFKRWQGK